MLVLHGHSVATNPLKVQLLLEELGLPFQLRLVDLFGGEQRTEAFLALNPVGAVPVLVDGDFVLAESNAILRYLARREGAHDWYPQDARGAAWVDQALDWITLHVNRVLGTFFGNHVVAPAMGESPDAAELEEATRSLQRPFAHLERLLTGAPYLVGQAPTLADVGLWPFLAYHRTYALSFEQTPALAAWVRRMEDRPAWRRIVATGQLGDLAP